MISTKKVIYKICQSIGTIKSDATTTSTAVTALQTDMQTALPLLGEIRQFAGSTAPSKWLVCDGSAVSRTTYADLFAVIGTTYGTGDGSTTFNLPDFKGRTAIGSSTSYALGTTGGEATHTLTVNEMPSHAHGSGAIAYINGTPYGFASLPSTGNHIAFASWTTNAAGGGLAHNNMQPYCTVNYIIYAGA